MAQNIIKTSTVETETFYHRNSNFTCYHKAPTRVVVNGVAVDEDVAPIRFSGTTGDYGCFQTNDPEQIAYLRGRSDVLSPGQYMEVTMTPEQKVARAQAESRDKERIIQENNTLIQSLQSELAARGVKSGQQQPQRNAS